MFLRAQKDENHNSSRNIYCNNNISFLEHAFIDGDPRRSFIIGDDPPPPPRATAVS